MRDAHRGDFPCGRSSSYLRGMSSTLPIAETAPDVEELTAYDIRHLVTYLRLLDADYEGADWQEAASIVLGLVRARWMTETGHQLLSGVDETLWDANRPRPLSS
jgi:hypothetical protein